MKNRNVKYVRQIYVSWTRSTAAAAAAAGTKSNHRGIREMLKRYAHPNNVVFVADEFALFS